MCVGVAFIDSPEKVSTEITTQVVSTSALLPGCRKKEDAWISVYAMSYSRYTNSIPRTS